MASEKKEQTKAAEILQQSASSGRRMLNEYQAKALLTAFGVPVVEEWLCKDSDEAAARAADEAAPVALKLCSPDVAHKKEMGFVALWLSGAEAARSAAQDMLARASAGNISVDGLLVQRMARGERELLAGMRRDPTFGPCVTLGLGGIFTEVLKDVSVRAAPLTETDAAEMLHDLKSSAMFGNYRGLAPIDMKSLAALLMALGEIGLQHKTIMEIDVNPVIVGHDGTLTAVDALIVLG